MVDRLDPGQVTVIDGMVRVSRVVGTVTVANPTNKPLLVDDRDVREAVVELWKAVQELRERMELITSEGA